MEKKVSVIIPIYNVEQYLDQCIQSVMNQTYKNLQIILVDDGSPDACPTICDKYAELDGRIEVIHKENGGLSDARNVGMDIADGDYIEFVDSDDWIHLELIEKQIKLAEKYEAEVVATTCLLEGDTPATFSEYINIGTECMYSIFQNKPMGTEHWTGWNAWGKLYKKELIQDMRFPVGKLYEDLGFVPYVYFKNPKVVIWDAGWYYYEIHESSIMNLQKRGISPDIVEIMEKLLVYAQKNHLDVELIYSFILNKLFDYIINRLWKDKESEKIFCKKVRKIIRHNFLLLFTSKSIRKKRKLFYLLFLFRLEKRVNEQIFE